MSEKLSDENIHTTIAKGALVNVLGAIAKLAHPLLYIVLIRLYGANIGGAYILVVGTILTVVLNLAVSGVNDGIQLFASRALEAGKEKGEETLYQVIANGFVVSLSICLLVLLSIQFGSSLMAPLFDQEVITSLRLASWALPFMAIPVVVVASTKALLIMKWEALIQSSLAPLSLLFFAVTFYFVSPTLEALFFAFLTSSILVAIVSLIVFSKHFSYRKLLHSILHFRFHKKLLIFAIPQNLNMTFNTFITQLDILMLGYFRVANEIIAFYGIAAQIVFQLRQVKLAFSGIYAPIISRLQERGDFEKINVSFSMISRWIMTIALPAAVLVAIFRTDLVGIVDSSFRDRDNSFMLVLLIAPLFSCTFGLAGNVLIMTGHSLWNLGNSILIASINLGLNFVLIPKYGLMGAAIATAIAASLVTTLQVIESYYLEKVYLAWRKVYKPVLAILPGASIVAYTSITHTSLSVTQKILAASATLALYALVLTLLGLEEEVRNLVSRKKAR